jgi:hypothetical protein
LNVLKFNISAVEEYCRRNLSPGVLSPFNTVTDYKRCATYLVSSAGRPPTTIISPTASHITYKENTLEVNKWRSGLSALLEEANAMLDKLSLGENASRVIPDIIANFYYNHLGNRIGLNIPDNVPDDMTNDTRNYSWLNNGTFVPEDALLKALLSSRHPPFWLNRAGGLVWDLSMMREFMLNAGRVNELISVLLHCLPGQPARGSEFIDAKIRNSTRPRTIFRTRRDMWTVTRRVKFENMVRKDSFIPSKIPPALVSILEYYLLVIRPLEESFAQKLYGADVAELYHEFLFVQMEARTTEEEFSLSLKRISGEYFGCPLSVRPYRQMVVGMANAYIGSEYVIDDEDDDALAQQAGHSLSTRNSHYALEFSRLSALTNDMMFRYQRISESWWKMAGLFPGNIYISFNFPYLICCFRLPPPSSS